jgi:hypothetical protein
MVRTFLLAAILILTSACSSVRQAASEQGPSDKVATQIVVANRLSIRDVTIKSKAQCEISNNIKATGVSERWIITYEGTVERQISPDYTVNEKMTIQKLDGKWVLYRNGANCGNALG